MIWIAFTLLLLPPKVASLAAVTFSGGLLLHQQVVRRASGPRSFGQLAPNAKAQMAVPIAAIMVLAGMLAIGVAWRPGVGWELEAAKIAIAGLMLLGGSAYYVPAEQQARFHLVVSATLMAVGSFGSFVRSFSLSIAGLDLALPEGNHAAVLVCVLAPVALSGLKSRHQQLLYLALLALFGLAILSRLVIGALILLVAKRVGRDPVMRAAILAAVGLVVFGPRFRGLDFGNFSDRLRLRIWEVGFDRIVDGDFLIIADGETRFLDDLNAEPLYRSLEVSHAHNLALHIWNSYGLIVTAMWVAAALWLVHALWGTSAPVNAQLVAFVAIAQFESIVSDVRVLVVIMFVFGLRLRSAERLNPPPSPTSQIRASHRVPRRRPERLR